MRHENKRWQQVWGGGFIALALLLYALLFVGSATKRPEAGQFRERLKQLSVGPALVQAIPANRLTSSSWMKVVEPLSSPPALCLLFVGVAWFWNARKQVGLWAYRVLAACFVLLSAGALVAVYIARGSQLVKSSPPLTLAAIVFLGVGVLFFWRARKLSKQVRATETVHRPAAPERLASRGTSRPVGSFALCNVLQEGAETRKIWQFDVRKREFHLHHEHTSGAGESLPGKTVGKSWDSLWQRKLNVAWLPPENVFIRVAHFPQSTPEETRTMVELQLEKLSPIPVTQAVWSMHVLPRSAGNMQTVAVIIVARSVVEEFLGRLEGQGFLADRLELPMLDQLQATSITEDGAWIYPGAQGGKNMALVAWWYGGVLQSVGWLTLALGANRAGDLNDQLTHMAWAGELEGWLTASPRWHLVAEAALATEWEPPLRQSLDQPVEIVAPLPAAELAALTAKRTAQAGAGANLLPDEFAKRYRQQFVDRLWMRGLGALLALYVVGLFVYFIAVGVLSMQTRKVEASVADHSPAYTNAIRLKARYQVLKDRQDLKYAALDCWQAVAETMPAGLTLDSMNFSDGKKITLTGTAPASQLLDVSDFSSKIRRTPDKSGQPLFDAAKADQLQTHVNPGTAVVSWSLGLELKRGERR
jgi:hypothetical protein